jgi:hypothetical protein
MHDKLQYTNVIYVSDCNTYESSYSVVMWSGDDPKMGL